LFFLKLWVVPGFKTVDHRKIGQITFHFLKLNRSVSSSSLNCAGWQTSTYSLTWLFSYLNLTAFAWTTSIHQERFSVVDKSDAGMFNFSSVPVRFLLRLKKPSNFILVWSVRLKTIFRGVGTGRNCHTNRLEMFSGAPGFESEQEQRWRHLSENQSHCSNVILILFIYLFLYLFIYQVLIEVNLSDFQSDITDCRPETTSSLQTAHSAFARFICPPTWPTRVSMTSRPGVYLKFPSKFETNLTFVFISEFLSKLSNMVSMLIS